jgi:glycosyltransferase 2 family protein
MIKPQFYQPTELPVVSKVNRKKLALQLGGLLLFGFFLWKLNLSLERIATTLWSANLWLVAASVLVIFPILGLKAWRWQLIMRDLGIRINLRQSFSLYALGLSAGSFTPGQIGDALKAFYLRDKGFSLGGALISVVLDRLFDLAALLMLACAGLFFLGTNFIGHLVPLLGFSVGIILALGAVGVPVLRGYLLKVARKVLLSKNRRYQAEVDLPPVKFGYPALITLITAGLASGRVWFLALAIGLNLELVETVASSTLATVAGLLPISIAGIGTRDLTLVAILDKLGYAAELAISLSALILLLNLANLVIGYVVWLVTKGKAEF